ncbi:MAG: hypothetical protein K8T25_19390, partial [Planctomycetia bacterium]|nr:hypothetical protein [Planctomycetia bacterium]
MASREDSPARKAELNQILAAFLAWQRDKATPEQSDLWGKTVMEYARLAVAHRASGLQALGVDAEDAQAEVVAGLLKSLKTVKLRENNPRCLVGLITFAARNHVINVWRWAKANGNKANTLREADAPEDF